MLIDGQGNRLRGGTGTAEADPAGVARNRGQNAIGVTQQSTSESSIRAPHAISRMPGPAVILAAAGEEPRPECNADEALRLRIRMTAISPGS